MKILVDFNVHIRFQTTYIDFFSCYRISNKKPVVAKVSPNSLRLEREYYIMKRLYQLSDGSSFLGN